jgi:hypothetical protein
MGGVGRSRITCSIQGTIQRGAAVTAFALIAVISKMTRLAMYVYQVLSQAHASPTIRMLRTRTLCRIEITSIPPFTAANDPTQPRLLKDLVSFVHTAADANRDDLCLASKNPPS